MSEILADLDTTVVSPEGDEYYVQVVGEHLLTGMWEAWLEFVPLDDALEVLRTTTETTQTTREDVVRWSETLTQVYLQGAFARAVDVSDGGSVVRNYATVIADVAAPFDPFEVLPLGKAAPCSTARADTARAGDDHSNLRPQPSGKKPHEVERLTTRDVHRHRRGGAGASESAVKALRWSLLFSGDGNAPEAESDVINDVGVGAAGGVVGVGMWAARRG